MSPGRTPSLAPTPTTSVLLDTHAWLWWNSDADKIPSRTRSLIRQAGQKDKLFVSAISAWELSMLVSKRRVELDADVLLWLERALSEHGLSLHPLTPSVAVQSNRLLGDFHGDPSDRIIVATAMELDATLVTKDEKIRGYPHVLSSW